MTNPELFEIMDRFERSSLGALKLSEPGFSLELDRAAGPAGTSAPPSSVPAPSSAREEKTVCAPLIGTFHARPGPDQPFFVSAGSRVSKGQTLCLLESMKMMNEVPAPCDCVIEEVLKADGQLASFGDPLFRYTLC